MTAEEIRQNSAAILDWDATEQADSLRKWLTMGVFEIAYQLALTNERANGSVADQRAYAVGMGFDPHFMITPGGMGTRAVAGWCPAVNRDGRTCKLDREHRGQCFFGGLEPRDVPLPADLPLLNDYGVEWDGEKVHIKRAGFAVMMDPAHALVFAAHLVTAAAAQSKVPFEAILRAVPR